MKKTNFLYVLLCVALAVGFVACDDDSNDSDSSTIFDGVWVSDSVKNANGETVNDAVMWEILNSQQVRLNEEAFGVCSWKLESGRVFTFSKGDNASITVEGLNVSPTNRTIEFEILPGGNTDMLGLQNGGTHLYMYRCPLPQGSWLPVSEANIVGLWRLTSSEGKWYDEEGNVSKSKREYYGLQEFEILAGGTLIIHDGPTYTQTSQWELDNETLYVDQMTSYYVRVKKNYMELVISDFQKGKSTEMRLYRMK